MWEIKDSNPIDQCLGTGQSCELTIEPPYQTGCYAAMSISTWAFRCHPVLYNLYTAQNSLPVAMGYRSKLGLAQKWFIFLFSPNLLHGKYIYVLAQMRRKNKSFTSAHCSNSLQRNILRNLFRRNSTVEAAHIVCHWMTEHLVVRILCKLYILLDCPPGSGCFPWTLWRCIDMTGQLLKPKKLTKK